MKSKSWKDIAEQVSLAAIVVGLVFVYLELRQSSTNVRVEMSNETNQILAELDAQERDPNFAIVLVKAESSPEDLSHAERVQLNAYYRRVLQAYARENYYYRRGIFEEWTSPIRRTAPRYFGSGYGRAWWDTRKRFFISPTRKAVAEEVDRSLENLEAVEFYKDFDGDLVQRIQEN